MSASSSSSSSQKLQKTMEFGEDTSSSLNSGILGERVLLLLFQFLKWDIQVLCRTASVNRRLRALAKRLLWRELCLYRAPRMVSSLTEGATRGSSRMAGGWQPLAKLLFFCGGCESSANFAVPRPRPGHFVKSTRFSKTSGRSFLLKNCRADVLYVSDPCEHPTAGNADDIGVYRGVFREFMKSRTREFLIGRRVEFDALLRCPYCGARVWSMTDARLIPRKSAARRLGSNEDSLEYFVCLHGHLHGTCWLAHLSSDNDDNGPQHDDDDEDEPERADVDGDTHDV